MSRKAGFSLIEVLVASVILAVVLLLIAQILGATTSTTAESRQRLEADRNARLALDRMGFDLSRSLFRSDMGFAVAPQTGNDTLAFYSEVPGEGGGSTISAVGYRVVPGRGLERASVTIPWDELAFDASLPPVFAEEDYRLLAPGVIRLEAGFLLDGDFSDPNSPDPEAVSVTHAHSLPAGISVDWIEDLRAVVITLAVVDGNNFRLFADVWEGTRTTLADGSGNRVFDFSGSPESATLNPVFSDWDRAVRESTATSNATASAAIRLYSRVIQIP